MFDTLAGRSDTPKPKRFSALTFALGAHVVILSAALFVTLKPDAPPPKPDEGPVIYVRPLGKGDNQGHKGEDTIRKVENQHKHPRKRPEIPTRPPEITNVQKAAEPDPSPEVTATSNVGAQLDNGGGKGPGRPDGIEGESGDCPPGGPGCAIEVPLPDKVIIYGPNMTKPHPDSTCVPPTPIAPYAASQMGIEGRVIATYVVHADGRADSLQVLNADAPTLFVDAVRAFLERCRFQPSEADGHAVSVKLSQTFRFDAAH